MASIERVAKENPIKKGNVWILDAGIPATFEVKEWIPIDVNGDITHTSKPQKVEWIIKDMKGGLIDGMNPKILDILQQTPMRVTINKQYSGSYCYMLEAKRIIAEKKNSIVTTYIRGKCDPLITNASWFSDKDYTQHNPLNQGKQLYVRLDTEGLNGDDLTIEIFRENKADSIASKTTKCVNGIVKIQIPTMGFVPVDIKPLKFGGKTQTSQSANFTIKVKNSEGYIQYGGKDSFLPFQVNAKIEIGDLPENPMTLKVGKPDISVLPSGLISMECLKIDTKYDVCNDEVKDYDDYPNFWILKGKNETGSDDYFHWVKEREKGSGDENKPDPLPITLASTDTLRFDVIFKTIFPTQDVDIQVRARSEKYTFSPIPYPKKDKGEYTKIEFKATNTTQPYEKTIQYFPNFELIFDYSIDGRTWIPLGNSKFCLYLTWKEPEYTMFEQFDGPETSMQMRCTKSQKKCILETLLWIGCKNAGGLGKKEKTEEENETKILDSIFVTFETKKVKRAREGKYKIRNWDGIDTNGGRGAFEGMGYWRGVSAIDAQKNLPNSSKDYNSFYDVQDGFIARYFRVVVFQYGEFRCGEWTAFLVYILLTQGIKLTQLMIYSGRGYNSDYYYNQNTGVINKDMYKQLSLSYEYYYANWEFYVKGNWNFNDPNEPTLPPSLVNRAQGNTNPIHQFSDHVFAILSRNIKIVNNKKEETELEKKWFDPSYGIKSGTNFADNKNLLRDYASHALQGIGYYEFVKKYFYKTLISSIEDHLITGTIPNDACFFPYLATVHTIEDQKTGNMIDENKYGTRICIKHPRGVVSIIDSSGKTIKTF